MSLLNENAMPAIFFGHGSPENILEDNTATRMWQQLGKELPKPKGIICISAHWYTSNTAITSMESPKTIHDFGGFPKAMYEMQYPAPGSLVLASKLSVILAEENAQLDSTWGFDHGTWCVLAKVFPKADVPVVQLSINNTKDMAFHFRVGQKLAELRKQGYWVIGSGNIVHNLGVMNWNKRNMTFNWAQRFGDYIRDAVSTNTPENVINYLDFGAEAKMSVPHPDHFIPLLYVLGARLTDDDCRFETTYAEYGSLDMTSIIFS
jgi:4,5-DOPA dioxygenase extradiol